MSMMFRHLSLRNAKANCAARWLAYRRLNRAVMLLTVAMWSALWDLNRSSSTSSAGVLFWLPPILGLGVHLTICYVTDAAVLDLKWSLCDAVRQAAWRLASFPVPLLMVAAGFYTIFDSKSKGVGWIVCAGIVARIATAFLRRAEGMGFHEAKAGELRNRTFAIAKRMGTTIRRVYIVPAGKGHLTNAFGGSGVVGVTDNWGKHFTKSELDFILGHEIAHVKFRHSRKRLLLIVATFSLLIFLCLELSRLLGIPRAFLDLAVVIVPVMILDFTSRRFEYAADREAVNLVSSVESAIRALATVYGESSVPARCSRFVELFLTHPTLAHRANAIAKNGDLTAERLDDILRTLKAPSSVSGSLAGSSRSGWHPSTVWSPAGETHLTRPRGAA
jgi:Zn-dependent protease with chaperone function